jgi:hypothetical protein
MTDIICWRATLTSLELRELLEAAHRHGIPREAINYTRSGLARYSGLMWYEFRILRPYFALFKQATRDNISVMMSKW